MAGSYPACRWFESNRDLMENSITFDFDDSVSMIALWRRHRDEVYDDAINNVGYHSEAADIISKEIGYVLDRYNYIPLITGMIYNYDAVRQELHDLPKLAVHSLKKDPNLPDDIKLYLKMSENFS